MSVEDVRIIRLGKAALDQAIDQDPTLTIAPSSRPWLVGQVWGESRFGQTPDWKGSNNFGAIVYHLGDGRFVTHGDHDASGNPTTPKFQAYASPLDAAKDFLRVIWRGRVPLALTAGTLRDYAAALYANGYYTGISGDANDRAIAYAAMVFSSANYCDKLLDIANVQDRLASLGFAPGPVDGVVGPLTTAAITSFQKAYGIVPADGALTPASRADLFRGQC